MGEDESGLSDVHAAGFDAFSVRAADVALAVGGSLAALACAAGPDRARSPRVELVRDLAMVGVAPRISAGSWTLDVPKRCWLAKRRIEMRGMHHFT